VRTYGNGRWSYTPDLTGSDWLQGLAEPPRGMAAGKLRTAAAGEAGAAVWHFRTPYIVADAEVELDLFRKSAKDTIRLLLSVDEGLTWRSVWECPAKVTGAARVTAAICDKYTVTAPQRPPEGFNSPFGRYAYLLKLELTANENPDDCRVAGIAFDTVVQHNLFALPLLQPGRNRISVRGGIAPGAALRVTYLWDDAAGQVRRNVTIVEQAPYSYEIVAAGNKWEDCRCRSLMVEAIAADGRGNRTEVKEVASSWNPLPALAPAIATRGRAGWLVRADPAKLTPVAQCIADLADPGKRDGALKHLVEHRSPAAFEALKKIVYEERGTHHKAVALVTLFHSDRERAKAVFLDILENPGKVQWTDRAVRKGPRNGDEHWAETAALIGAMAVRAGWIETIPGQLKVLEHPVAGKASEARYIIMRNFAACGDERVKKAVLAALRGRGEEASWAALAAARIGAREALGDIRRLLAGGNLVVKERAARALGRLGDGESATALRKLLRHEDENLRAAGAAALGDLGAVGERDALLAALTAEPIDWVRSDMERAAARLRKGN
jgi:HEAT repeat protein